MVADHRLARSWRRWSAVLVDGPGSGVRRSCCWCWRGLGRGKRDELRYLRLHACDHLGLRGHRPAQVVHARLVLLDSGQGRCTVALGSRDAGVLQLCLELLRL